jgi:crotonobetainyl-CoA:carnitine CoA-transferase CaiB-like acyl-CoA transferase
MLAGMLALQNWRFEGYLVTGEVPQRTHGFQSLNPLYGIYETSDGEWIALSMYQSDPFWARFCRALGIENLEKDPRFDSHENRVENRDALVPVIRQEFAGRTREDLLKILEENDLQFAPVNNYAHLATDPQVIANNYIVDFDHPVAGGIKVLAVPIELSETPGIVGRAAPELGQHTEEVLLELGEYTWQEIAELKEAGVII